MPEISFWERYIRAFAEPILKIGSSEYSLYCILMFLFSVMLLFWISGLLKSLLVRRLLTKYSLEIGVRQSVGTIVRYVFVIIGMLILVQASGIDLSALGLLLGALGAGIGFGLQKITDNFISGLIILFSRPIKVGDRVEVGHTVGDVVDISARATTINTNDNITIIVPNSQFISNTVINWSHNDRNIRFWIPVGVAYKEDPAIVKRLLLEVANEHPGVLQNPAPDVVFDAYGDSSLNFFLLVWISSHINRPAFLKSDLYFAIFEKFKQHNIEIPFPQRDLHL